MVSAPKFLRADVRRLVDPHRHRGLLPHRLVTPLYELLLATAAQCRAIGESVEFNGALWCEAATALEEAAFLLQRVR